MEKEVKQVGREDGQTERKERDRHRHVIIKCVLLFGQGSCDG